MAKEFETVAQNIIDDSINSVLYIDDEIYIPFSDERNDHYSFCGSLYQSFKKNACLIDFLRFESSEDWRGTSLEGKDLLILDWLLENDKEKYESTLNIIDDAINTSSLHFLIIYTSEPERDFQEIFHQIIAYFSELNNQLAHHAKTNIIEFLESDGLNSDEIIQEILPQLKEIALYENKEGKLFQEIREFFLEQLNSVEDFHELLRELYEETSLANLYKKMGFCFNVNIFGQEYIPQQHIKSFFSEKFLILNHTIIQITNKEVKQPEDLYKSFSQILIESSNNYLTFMGLEMRNLFSKSSAFIGKDIDQIDELAFFHHEKTIKPEEAFYDFLKEIWKDQSSSFLYEEGKNPEIFNALIDYKEKRKVEDRLEKEFKKEEFQKNLASLNYYYNILNIERKKGDEIKFGDIFQIYDQNDSNKDRYLLCITAHCDCLYPEKLNNNFYFVEGNKSNLENSLEKGDRGFCSFIKHSSEEDVFPVSWKDKPLSIYIDSSQNNIDSQFDISIGIDTYSMKYACTLKENYAQRIANNAFTYPLHVGIFYADYSK